MKVPPWIFYISSALMFVSGFFVVNVSFEPEYALISQFAITFMALPTLVGVFLTYTPKQAWFIVFGLGLYALFFETVAILTGWPYTPFEYGERIGAKLLGPVPWSVFLAWSPLVISAYVVIRQQLPKLTSSQRIIIATVFLMMLDVVLDPGAVLLEFWIWEIDGWFYGVPLQNFFGWLVSGVFGMWFLESISQKARHINYHPLILWTGAWSMAFWTGVTLFGGLWVPAILGVILLGVLMFVEGVIRGNERRQD
jgi:putative membrane protein